MKPIRLYFLFSILVAILASWTLLTDNWISEKTKNYNLLYTKADKPNKKEYTKIIDKGSKSVQKFMNDSFKKNFLVCIHPNRKSLDSTWQKDWNMPGFKSECWMVASGTATRLDMISPKAWDKEACEHSYADQTKTELLIAHELFHVYHGQLNVSPDFSDVYDIDWFVEGLATYASGQCDSNRINEIKKLITDNKVPKSLNDFWKGKLKYGLSGSVVMYIDKTYDRAKLKGLLRFNKKTEILSALNTTEEKLLSDWKIFIKDLKQ